MSNILTAIHRRKTAIISIGVLAGCAALVEVLVLRQNGGLVALEKWQLGLILLPWVLLTTAFLSLLYLSWRGPKVLPGRQLTMRIMFWVIAAPMLGILAAVYGIFVLP